MHARRTLGFLALVALAACQQAETPEQRTARLAAAADTARAGIEAQLARFERWIGAGQFDSVVTLYTSNAVIMPPNTPAMDRDGMRAALQAGGPFAIDMTPVSVWSDGPTAVEHGTYTYSVTPPGGPAMNGAGKYMARWERVDGAWLMTHDIWNEDAPMAPPAPAGRR